MLSIDYDSIRGPGEGEAMNEKQRSKTHTGLLNVFFIFFLVAFKSECMQIILRSLSCPICQTYCSQVEDI
jgi:hypothetical protein